MPETEEEKEKREEEEAKKKEEEEEAKKKAEEDGKKKGRKKSGLKIDPAVHVSREEFDALGGRMDILEGIAELFSGKKLPKPDPEPAPVVKVPFMSRKFGKVGTLLDAFWDGDK